jgi:hypothetical protein
MFAGSIKYMYLRFLYKKSSRYVFFNHRFVCKNVGHYRREKRLLVGVKKNTGLYVLLRTPSSLEDSLVFVPQVRM